jgi:acylphosphatase
VGRVQGVGFRWTVVNIAKNLKLKGTVRNLPDGSVEIYAQGDQQVLDQLIKQIRECSSPAIVESIDANLSTPKTFFQEFVVLK